VEFLSFLKGVGGVAVFQGRPPFSLRGGGGGAQSHNTTSAVL